MTYKMMQHFQIPLHSSCMDSNSITDLNCYVCLLLHNKYTQLVIQKYDFTHIF